MDRTEPPDTLPWVDQFMRDVQRDYLFYDKTSNDRFNHIVFSEEKGTTIGGEERHYQEVCFRTSDGLRTFLQTINDGYVYYKHTEAEEALKELLVKMPDRDLTILAFRHSEDDWGAARTIEETVLVNKLGWGIFRRKDSLESSNTEGEGE